MINFLSRRVNPTRFVTFMPPEVIVFGESEMVDAVAARPPDIIAIWEKSTWEYGAASLEYYAPSLIEWVEEKYEMVDRIGQFTIMRRRSGYRQGAGRMIEDP